MLNNLNNKLKTIDEHTLEVFNKSISSFLVKFFGVVIGVLMSIALAHLLGADGLGVINLANRIINILIVLGLLGTRQIVIRTISIAREREDYQVIGDVMSSACWLNGFFSLIVSLVLIFLTPFLAEDVFNEHRLIFPMIVFLLALTPQVLSRIFSSALIGYRKIWQSNLVEQTLSIFITGFLLFLFWCIGEEITINNVAVFYVIGRMMVTLSMVFYWKKIFPFKQKWNINIKKLFKESTPLFITTFAMIFMNNIDTVFLGVFTTTEEIGLFAVAMNIAFLTSIFLQITNSSVAPKIASLFHSGRIKETELMMKKVTRGLFFLGFLQLIIFIFFGDLILSIWGREFKEAYWVLLILSVGQLFNVGTGAVGQLLVMTGYEKTNRNITMIFLFLNIILSFIMIQLYTIIGAAIVNALTVAMLNITRLIMAKHKTGISTI